MAVSELARGFGTLIAGFGWLRKRPRLFALGLVPALIVGAVLVTGIVILAAFLPRLSTWMTPFADDWTTVWVVLLRILVALALLIAALALSAVTFTALTLIVGEPCYDRIWRAVEADLGSTLPDQGVGFWRSLLDGVALILRGIGVGLLTLLIGFVPVIGSIAAAIIGLMLGGRLVADELTSRALQARGIDDAGRQALLARHRARVLGFGVATQLCFLIPLGAVLVMPAAVAGSTLLARTLIDDADSAAGATQ